MKISYPFRHNRIYAKTMVFLCSFVMTALMTRGVTVSLTAYTGYSGATDYVLLGPDGVTPMVDGSYVMIVGSYDSNRADFATYGVTNKICDSFTDTNDVVVGTFQLNTGVNPDGWFDEGGFTYESDQVKYLYIYYFTSTNWPVVGMSAWGYSPVIDATGYSEMTHSIRVDFTPGGNLYIAGTNNFVQIPEPGTGGLLVFFGLMGFFGLPGLMKACNAKKTTGSSEEGGCCNENTL